MMLHYYDCGQVIGTAIKLDQIKGNYQVADVLAFSPEEGNRAYECKSVVGHTRILNFRNYFTTDKYGIHQLERFSTFCVKGGFQGYLAVELRGRPKNQAWVIPIETVMAEYINRRRKIAGLRLSDLGSYAGARRLKRKGRMYLWRDL